MHFFLFSINIIDTILIFKLVDIVIFLAKLESKNKTKSLFFAFKKIKLEKCWI